MMQRQIRGHSQLTLVEQSAILLPHSPLIIKDILPVDSTAWGPLQICGNLTQRTIRGHKKQASTNGIFAAVSFVVNNKGYVTTGFGPLATSEYDPVTNMWAPKTAFPFLLFSSAGFSIGNFGYAGTGITNPTTNDKTKQWWQYNPVTDAWTQKTDFGGIERANAIAFSIGQKGYLGTGEGADFWEYTPDSTTAVNEVSVNSSEFNLYPNPASEILNIKCLMFDIKKIALTIVDLKGNKAFHSAINPHASGQTLIKINIRHFSKGVYLISVDNGHQKKTKKFFKE